MSKHDEEKVESKSKDVLKELESLQSSMEMAVSNFKQLFTPEIRNWETHPVPDTIDKNTAEKQIRRLTAVRFDMLDGIGLIAKRMNALMTRLG